MYKHADKRDHHRELTDKIIAKMEEAVAYEKPWFSSDVRPYNPVTGTRYKGINAISLMVADYLDPRFFTFNNVRDLADKTGLDIHVKKGSRGIPIFKAAQIKVKDPDGKTSQTPGSPENKLKTFWIMAYSGTVFNASQIENLPALEKKEIFNFIDHDEAELLSKAMQIKEGVVIEHGKNQKAFYQPKTDTISLPYKKAFRSEEHYYCTLTHEFGHSTGHEKRLNRPQINVTGSTDYAYEELIAELTSYFMGHELKLPYNPETHENHAAYLKSWIAALQGDKNYIFKAASAANRACEFQLKVLHTYKQDIGLIPPDAAPENENQAETVSVTVIPPVKTRSNRI